MFEVWQIFSQQVMAQSPWEVVAVVLAIAYVWLAARQNIWCWPAALISTAIYTVIFWQVTLPFHAGLNAYYMLMAVYGWWQWQKQDEPQAVKRWPMLRHAIAIMALTCITYLLSLFAGQFWDSEYLYLDALITVFSVFTTVLVAHKVLENWLYWMVINSMAVHLYLAKALYLTAILFVLYFVFACYGWLKWRGSQQQAEV